MKNFLVLVIIYIPFFVYAQSDFTITSSEGIPYENSEVVNIDITENDLIFGEYKFFFNVNNMTNQELKVYSTRTNIDLIEGMRAYVCFGVCVPDDVYDIDCIIKADTTESYQLHLLPEGKFGTSFFKIEIWSKENQTDLFTIFVNIKMNSLNIFVQQGMGVSLSVFPNPASEYSNINVAYAIHDLCAGSQLVVRNLVGALVREFPIYCSEGTIRMDASLLKSGIYYYSIENRKGILVTKKMIIK